MKTRTARFNPAFGALAAFGATVLALSFATPASAQCGGAPPSPGHHVSWHPQFRQPGLQLAAYTKNGDHFGDDVSVVGFWHVKFVSDGVSSGISPAPPPGAPIDAGYSQWHSDGTEIMNSGHFAPNESNFCLGVWEQTGPREYQLNHFATFWDPTKGPVGPAGPAGELVGPANVREAITLAPNGETFAGTFTIDQYDENLNHLVHLQGKITGTRITVSTPPSSIF
ncbi:MAG: hypothetical protein ABR971_04695 [Acidobacteriaceae bacterium]|jgi:hypothetical protein